MTIRSISIYLVLSASLLFSPSIVAQTATQISLKRAGNLHTVDANNSAVGPTFSVSGNGMNLAAGTPDHMVIATWINVAKSVGHLNQVTGRVNTQTKTYWSGLNCTGNAYADAGNMAHVLYEDFVGNPFTVQYTGLWSAGQSYQDSGGCVSDSWATWVRPISFVTIPNYPFPAPLEVKLR